MDVVLILRHNPDSWLGGGGQTAAVAADEEAARRWIEFETTQNPDTKHQYAQGQTIDFWLSYGTFSFKTVTIFE